ncbi:Haloacid dehalogenase-like hydrolase domain-containing 3 [Mycena kentingensis (nom. inval.)]|nr:Haloacid dehalogenase-like hydrolase domain-containing 3 [Mycena kentingensis (nom. inval.)]
MLRLVSFDLLHTLILPRHPIHVAYARAFEPFLGPLDPQAIKAAFGPSLRKLQTEKPLYGGDTTQWWAQVIRETALGAGANAQELDASLERIVSRLMKTFSSGEGYTAREHSMDVLHTLHHELGLRTTVVSNADARMFSVLEDLGFPTTLAPVILSEVAGVEKPSREIFRLMLERVNAEAGESIQPNECLHVGDELECDYEGARNAGMDALLLHRPDEQTSVGEGVRNMKDLLDWVRERQSN